MGLQLSKPIKYSLVINGIILGAFFLWYEPTSGDANEQASSSQSSSGGGSGSAELMEPKNEKSYRERLEENKEKFKENKIDEILDEEIPRALKRDYSHLTDAQKLDKIERMSKGDILGDTSTKDIKSASDLVAEKILGSALPQEDFSQGKKVDFGKPMDKNKSREQRMLELREAQANHAENQKDLMTMFYTDVIKVGDELHVHQRTQKGVIYIDKIRFTEADEEQLKLYNLFESKRQNPQLAPIIDSAIRLMHGMVRQRAEREAKAAE